MIRLAVRLSRDQAEVVLAELLELAPAGVEEVDLGGEVVEYAVYGPPGELPALPDLHAIAGAALVEVSTSEIPDDWQQRWRDFHRPVLVSPPASAFAIPSLHVRPPWEPSYAGPDHAAEIVIDPGQAFGTGAHATTRLCLELLLEVAAAERRRGPLLDIGTGSGVLAIAASVLGYAPVLALDNDPASTLAATENAAANDVVLDIRPFDLHVEPVPDLGTGEAPTVLANLLRPLLIELAGVLAGPPANLLAGGLLAEEADEVAAHLCSRLGMHERERRRQGEWAALWLAPD